METKEQKKRRLFGKQFLGQYLDDLGEHVKFKIDASDLLSILETDEIIEKNKIETLLHSNKISFVDKAKLPSVLNASMKAIINKPVIDNVNAGVRPPMNLLPEQVSHPLIFHRR